MIAVSSILRLAIYPAMSRIGLFSRRLNPGDVCALTYHGVLPDGASAGNGPIAGTQVSASKFREQLRFLKSRYQLITPEDFYRWCTGSGPLPEKAILLTCDDGFVTALTEMVPILQEEAARCLFFVTGASLAEGPEYLWYEELYRMLGRATDDRITALERKLQKNRSELWKELLREFSKMKREDRAAALDSLRKELGHDENRRPGLHDDEDERSYRLLNGAELRELAGHGMTLGAHTMSHPRLSAMPAELAGWEIGEIRTRLKAESGQEIWALAYPFGDEGSAGEREMKMAESAGYACAFLNHGGGCFRCTNPRFGLPRAHVSSAMSLAELEANLSGFHQKLQGRFGGAGR